MVMEPTAGETGALGEAVVFLDYFKDLPDPQQRGKVLYPLDEVLLLCLLAVLAGSEAITDIAGSARRNSSCCGGSARFATERLPTTTSTTFWRRSTPSSSSDASSRGWRRRPVCHPM